MADGIAQHRLQYIAARNRRDRRRLFEKFRIDQSRWPQVLSGLYYIFESRKLILYSAMRHQTMNLAAGHIESSGISADSAGQGIEILGPSRLSQSVLILLSSGQFGHNQEGFGRSFGHYFGHNISAMFYRSRPS
jgi:hypothetical protein